MLSIDQIAEKHKKDFSNYLKIIRELSYKRYPTHLDNFAALRGFYRETLEKYEVFYIGDGVELLHPLYLDHLESFGLIDPTNKKPIFHNRTVFTIKDAEDFPIALVGYQKDSNNRYLYGSNALFYERDNDLFGLSDYYRALDIGVLFFVEGITDKMALEELPWMQENNYPIVANCGSKLSRFKIQQLNRNNLLVILISDRDSAGEKLCRLFKKDLKRYAICRPPYVDNDIANFITSNREIANQVLPLYFETIINESLSGKNALEYTII